MIRQVIAPPPKKAASSASCAFMSAMVLAWRRLVNRMSFSGQQFYQVQAPPGRRHHGEIARHVGLQRMATARIKADPATAEAMLANWGRKSRKRVKETAVARPIVSSVPHLPLSPLIDRRTACTSR